jgi:hypothetical protein
MSAQKNKDESHLICECGWKGKYESLIGEYPHQSCPKCGADASQIPDVLPEEE